MTLVKAKKEAIARLKSPTGHLSGHTPEEITYRGERLALWQIVKMEKEGKLEEREEVQLITLLRAFVLEKEAEIEAATSVEEVKEILEMGLGARRVLVLLERRYEKDHLRHDKREDAKRWLGFSKQIKG